MLFSIFLSSPWAWAEQQGPAATPQTVTGEMAGSLSPDDAESALAVLQPPASASPELPPLHPFRAEFRARYNGKAIGQAAIELAHLPSGGVIPSEHFEIRYQMQATKGFASFVGANLDERGHFYWRNAKIVPAEFHHRSKAFLSKTVWDALFSVQDQRIAGAYEGDDYEHRYADGTLDPLTQFIYGAQQSLLQNEHWQHWEVMKGELREYHFQRDALAPLETECADLSAWRVERRRMVSTATQEIWYSPELPWVPVQLRNVQKDGDELVLELQGLELNGALHCGSIDRSLGKS